MAMMARNIKTIMQQLMNQSRSITTGVPKMKSTATPTPTLGDEVTRAAMAWRKQPSWKEQFFPKGKPIGDYVPVYVGLGLISLSVTLGLLTAKHQLMHAPDVRVKKSKRETLPEIVEPEHVVHESEEFINKSLFRKVAHIDKGLELEKPVSYPMSREPKVESLKTVGVEPVLDSGLHRCSRDKNRSSATV